MTNVYHENDLTGNNDLTGTIVVKIGKLVK